MLHRQWRRAEALAQIVMLATVVQLLAAVPNRPMHAQAGAPLRIVAFGDSLTAGFRLPRAESFPAQLERALKAKGHAVEVINAGVSGDTTAAGLERLDWAVPEGAQAVIVELGANDALRGLPPAEARRNLDAILARLAKMGARVLLAGMRSPRNWGEAYVAEFDRIFPELAKTHGAILYPFFLEGVALRPELSLDDGLHPNREGVALIVRRMLPAVEQLIAEVRTKQARGGGG